jgi:2-isopropylmalate synthase
VGVSRIADHSGNGCDSDGNGEAVNSSGEILQDAATGDGPIDAIYSTIQRICNITVTLGDYQIRALTKGKEA